jgi:hypothetical protein
MLLTYLKEFIHHIENIVESGNRHYSKILVFTHIINVLYVIMFSVFGVTLLNYQGITDINTSIRIMVCVILMIKYHPFRKHTLTDNDSTLIFSSAAFLFLNLSIFELWGRLTTTITDNVETTIKTIIS